MRNAYPVCKRELKNYFNSPIAYTVLFVFLIASGYTFYNIFLSYTTASFRSLQSPELAEQLNLTEWVVRPLFGNMSVFMLLIMPLLTMRLFSEEKKAGTIELLLTYPIRDSEAVLGKFAACLGVFALMLILTLPYPVILLILGQPELGPLLTGYLGLLLLGTAFISLGILISSLTENQIVAAILTFGVLLLFWMVDWSSSTASASIGAVLTHLSIIGHFDNFAKGVIDTSDVIYYLNFILFCLFLNLRALESKKWRG